MSNASSPRTEADRKRTPSPVREGRGQRSSQERGAHTRSKKNPGKRAKKGG
ncbi:MAG: hypothetical protein V4739_14085 [Pseudomonadota bacterium]